MNVMKLPLYSVFSFLFFCLKQTEKKNTWMKAISITVMVIISKVLLLKSLDISYVCSKFFLNIYEAHRQRHLKDTLQMKILQQSVNIRANSSLVNIMKRKWAKVAGKLSVAQKYEPVLSRAFHLLLYSSFPLK